jgi:hypothetical protein
MFALIGGGFPIVIYGAIGALLGTLIYGMVSSKLP